MLSYQIGRIEGTWTNFLPPIQGGKFRPDTEDACSTEEDLSIRENSSSEGSIPPSPIFDAVDSNPTIRRKNPSPSTDSSAVSTPPNEDDQPRPHFLDARTREEIVFDTTKYPSLDTASQESIKRKYRDLNERMLAEGLFDCNYMSYFVECCRYTLFASLSVSLLAPRLVGNVWILARLPVAPTCVHCP